MSFLPYNKSLKNFSRVNRKSSTLGEILMWQQLKGKKMGYLFNRQKPILNFIADFYCKSLSLVIEIDGGSHDNEEQHLRDLKKAAQLEGLGLRVMRFTEKEIRDDMVNVLRTLQAFIEEFEKKGR